jgi:hypothetical protein
MKSTFKIFVGNPEGKRKQKRCMGRWDDDIKMELR